jgi:hypothetical protein
MFINGAVGLVECSLGTHNRLDRNFRDFRDTYQAQYEAYVAAGWGFEWNYEDSLAGAEQLALNGASGGYWAGGADNAWADIDDSGEWLPNVRRVMMGGTPNVGILWFDAAWQRLDLFPPRVWTESDWTAGYTIGFPPMTADDKYAVGMQFRCQVRISQLQCAHSVRLLLCLGL